MMLRKKSHLLLPLLVLGMTLVTAATVRAQAYSGMHMGTDNTSMTLQITFGSTPHWTSMQGTRVQRIRDRERPDYDMFRYGGYYYVYNNDRWYSSRRAQGQFRMIDDRRVPVALMRVPSRHWRNYPSGWMDNRRNPRNGNYGDRHDRGQGDQGDNRRGNGRTGR